MTFALTTYACTIYSLDAAVILGFLWATARLSRKTRRLPLPPGPLGLPIVGNALQIPSERQWLAFATCAEHYGTLHRHRRFRSPEVKGTGDVFYLNVLRQPTLVLSSFAAASELLDARGNIYSDRPSSVMAGELCVQLPPQSCICIQIDDGAVVSVGIKALDTHGAPTMLASAPCAGSSITISARVPHPSRESPVCWSAGLGFSCSACSTIQTHLRSISDSKSSFLTSANASC